MAANHTAITKLLLRAGYTPQRILYESPRQPEGSGARVDGGYSGGWRVVARHRVTGCLAAFCGYDIRELLAMLRLLPAVPLNDPQAVIHSEADYQITLRWVVALKQRLQALLAVGQSVDKRDEQAEQREITALQAAVTLLEPALTAYLATRLVARRG